MKRCRCAFVIMALFMLLLVPVQKSEAANVKLSKKSMVMDVNETAVLKVKNSTDAVKWSTNSKNILLESGKRSVKITALHSGKAVVSATIGKKTLKCVVKVSKVPFEQRGSKQCVYNGQTKCVEWSVVSGAKGYEIEKKDAAGDYKFLTKVKGGSKNYFEDKTNQKNTPSYRIRAYKKVNGKTVYSKWTVQKEILEYETVD